MFWGLDAQLAYKRHFPSINWLNSYSLYADTVGNSLEKSGNYSNWNNMRLEAISLLQEESHLEEVVRLVGIDALSDKDRLKLEVSKSIREDYLQQNGFHEIDTFSSMEKQYKMIFLILKFKSEAERALNAGVYLEKILNLPIRDKIARSKYIPEKELSKMDDILKELQSDIEKLIQEEGVTGD